MVALSRGDGSLRLDIVVTPPQLRLGLAGELDFTCVEALLAVENLDLGAIRDVSLDLSELDFVDAAGIRGLGRLCAALTFQHRSVAVNNPRAHVRRFIEISGVAVPLVSHDRLDSDSAASASLGPEMPSSMLWMVTEG